MHGKRPVGRPKKRWLYNVRDDGKILGLTVEEADALTRDRERWKSSVTKLLERDCEVEAISKMNKETRADNATKIGCSGALDIIKKENKNLQEQVRNRSELYYSGPRELMNEGLN